MINLPPPSNPSALSTTLSTTRPSCGSQGIAPGVLSPSDLWPLPAQIAPNQFRYKSLSNWSLNFAVGCTHACRFCYVPSASTTKLTGKLRAFGVRDPDSEWGDYAVLRPWDEAVFLRSLQKAESTPDDLLKADGNRAIMLCSTTDAYQQVRHADPAKQRALNGHLRQMVRRALELIRDHSSLRVRVLTRSPLAKADFALYRSFGPRLLFGMSVPTLQDRLAKIYEPKAPAPSARLRTLQLAQKCGLHLYVAIAPTYPECDAADVRRTMEEVAKLGAKTIYHEPINIRSQNVERIANAAQRAGVPLRTEVFADRENWRRYALDALQTAEQIASDLHLEQLHLWPDASLGSQAAIRSMPKPAEYTEWLQKWWSRISEWPTE